MELYIGLGIGLIVALLTVLVIQKRSSLGEQNKSTSVAITSSEIREVIREIHSETLRDLAEQAKEDREDAINSAARHMGDAIDHTKKEIAETVGRLEAEVEKLRDDNSAKFGNVDNAVGQLSIQAANLTKVLSSSQSRGSWGERMLEDILSTSGLKRGINYEVQEKLAGEENRTIHFSYHRIEVFILIQSFRWKTMSSSVMRQMTQSAKFTVTHFSKMLKTA